MKDTLKARIVDAILWLPVDEVESQALDQIRNAASLPWAFHVAVMPDAHYGKGATVGSVIALKAAISPSAVGVDIGCGMAATKTSLNASHLPDSLASLRSEIERAVPVGFNSRSDTDSALLTSSPPLKRSISHLLEGAALLDKGVEKLKGRMELQIGTLGGGNHFVEVCLDKDGAVWVMLHSGSRNIGKSLADIHIARAKELAHNQSLPDRDLAVFLEGTPEMEAYRHDLKWAQHYAFLNRSAMLEAIARVMKKSFPGVTFEEPIQCHHNYVEEETHFGEDVMVTRKGAISARRGQMGIIPGSMGTRSYIVRGLGNPDSLHSASHGAGRKMSRSAAKRAFSQEDLEEQTAGVECRKDMGVLDEIPAAYKDIDQVMDRQKDLVEVVAELKQVLCVKG